MKKMVIGLMIGLILGIGGSALANKTTVKVVDIENRGTETLVSFSDESFAVIDEVEGLYMFQPAVMGDWDLQLENAEQLENAILTYISIQNTGSY